MDERLLSSPDVPSDVTHAFDPELREAQGYWEDYLNGRNSMDKSGRVRDAESGRFVSDKGESENDYYNRMHAESESSVDTRFAGKGLRSLAEMVRDARQNGDKTAEESAQAAFDDAFIEAAEKYGWEGVVKHADGNVEDRNSITDKRLAYYQNIIDGNAAVAESGQQASVESETPDTDSSLQHAVEALATLRERDDIDPELAAVIGSALAEIVRGSQNANKPNAPKSGSEQAGDGQEESADVGDVADEELPTMTPEEIRKKRARMVKSGLKALDVGNMTDEEIAAYQLDQGDGDEETPQDHNPDSGTGNDNGDLPDQELPPMTKDEIALKRTKLVMNGLPFMDVQEMSDEEVTAYNLVEGEPSVGEQYTNSDHDIDQTTPIDLGSLDGTSWGWRAGNWVRNRFASSGAIRFTPPAFIAAASSRMADAGTTMNERAENENRQGRKRMYLILGGIAISGAVVAADLLRKNGVDLWPFNNGNGSSATAAIPGINSGSGHEAVRHSVGTMPNEGVLPTSGLRGYDLNATHSGSGDKFLGLDISSIPHESLHVTAGEGGFQTLEEAGIPGIDWETTWESLGNALQKSGHSDWVYRMDDGRWGWAHTGTLTPDVLADAAKYMSKQCKQLTKRRVEYLSPLFFVVE